LFASVAPSANRFQPQANCTTERSKVKVLMSNGVAPIVEIFQVTDAAVVPAALCSYSIPKYQAKTVVVGTNVAWIRIPSVEFSMKCEFSAENDTQGQWSDGTSNVVNGFGVQISAETLKL